MLYIVRSLNANTFVAELVTHSPELGPLRFVAPGPRIAKPNRWEQIKGSGIASAIPCRDANQNISRRRLCVFDEDIEIAIAIEYAGIEQLEFGIGFRPAAVFGDQPRVGEFGLRILVQHLQIGVRGRGVEVEIAFLYVFAMIAFVTGQAKQAFLQDRIAAVPECRREADMLMAIAYSPDAVFAPAIGAGTGVVVRKIFPRRAIGAVILANRPPLALA